MERKLKRSKPESQKNIVWQKWDRLKRSDFVMPSSYLKFPSKPKQYNHVDGKVPSSQALSLPPRQTIRFNNNNGRFLFLGRRGDNDTEHLIRFPPMEKLFHELRDRCAQKDYRLSFGREMPMNNFNRQNNLASYSDCKFEDNREWSDSSTDCSSESFEEVKTIEKKERPCQECVESDYYETEVPPDQIQSNEQARSHSILMDSSTFINSHTDKSFVCRQDRARQNDSRVIHHNYSSHIQQLLSNKKTSDSVQTSPTPPRTVRLSTNQLLDCLNEIPERKSPKTVNVMKLSHSDNSTSRQIPLDKKPPILSSIDIHFQDSENSSDSDDNMSFKNEPTALSRGKVTRNYERIRIRNGESDVLNHCHMQEVNRLPDIVTSSLLGEPSSLSCAGKQLSGIAYQPTMRTEMKSRIPAFKREKNDRKVKAKSLTAPKYIYKDYSKFPYPEPQVNAPSAFLSRMTILAHNVYETVRYERNKIALSRKKNATANIS